VRRDADIDLGGGNSRGSRIVAEMRGGGVATRSGGERSTPKVGGVCERRRHPCAAAAAAAKDEREREREREGEGRKRIHWNYGYRGRAEEWATGEERSGERE
jgi:hypothetical protein